MNFEDTKADDTKTNDAKTDETKPGQQNKNGFRTTKDEKQEAKKRTHDDTMDVATEKKGKCIQNIGQLRSETFL